MSADFFSTTESRARLAAQQSALMEALTKQTPLTGFDTERLKATSVSLQHKRMRTVEHAHPCLASALGSRFTDLFLAYCELEPIPAGGPAADAVQFTGYLAQSDLLPDRMWRGYFFTTGWRNYQTWLHLLNNLGRKILPKRLSARAAPINPIPRPLN